MTSAVLKVTCEGHIYRVHFTPESGLAEAVAAVCKVVPRASDGMLTFGEEGPQVLTEQTYADFLAQGKEGPAGGVTFRVQLQLQAGGGTVDTPPSPAGGRASLSSSESGTRPKRCSGAVRRAQRREARAARAAVASHTWEEDPRDLDQLISALDGEAPPPVFLQKAVRKQGKATKAKKGSDSKAASAEEAQVLPNLRGDAKPAMPMLCSLQNIRADGHQEGKVREDDQGEAEDVTVPAEARFGQQALASSMQAPKRNITTMFADKASDCATESTCGDVGDHDVHEQATTGAESDSFDEPVELWPPTPESTPPSSPRYYGNQFQPVYWVPVPVWIPAMQ